MPSPKRTEKPYWSKTRRSVPPSRPTSITSMPRPLKPSSLARRRGWERSVSSTKGGEDCAPAGSAKRRTEESCEQSWHGFIGSPEERRWEGGSVRGFVREADEPSVGNLAKLQRAVTFVLEPPGALPEELENRSTEPIGGVTCTNRQGTVAGFSENPGVSATGAAGRRPRLVGNRPRQPTDRRRPRGRRGPHRERLG